MTTTPTPARQAPTCRAGARPAVRIRRVADVTVYDVHHAGRRKTWPSWGIAMAHALRLAEADARGRAS